jgi:hypothetical protein
MKRLLPILFAAALGAGCEPKEVNYALKIVTQSCDSQANPFDGVQFLRIRVTGDEMEPVETITSANPATREAKVPQIPAGKRRIVEVRGYDSDPASSGRTVSVGRSLPFDVPDVVPEDLVGRPVELSVVLRKVNTFSPVVSVTSPTQCQQLKVARAGHTATLLADGRVFIAGGFNFRPGVAERQALTATEIFNPATGTFETARPLSITSQGVPYELPRAYHAAIRIPNGQVVLWGGEVYVGGVNNTVSPIAWINFYDPVADDYGTVGSRDPPAIKRTRHSMAIDANGKVLVVGGLTFKSSLVPADEVEWLDPTASRDLFKIVPGVTLPRLGATVMPVKKGEFIAVAGGTDGTAMRPEITYFKFTGAGFAQQSLTPAPRLADPGRRGAAAATIRNGDDLVILGGYGHPTNLSPLASSEVLTAGTASVAVGPDVRAARGDLCAVTMSDGTVLATGGRTSDAGGPPRSDATAVLVSASTSGAVGSVAVPNLPRPRYHHTCTALLDGTVLITGGINEGVDGSLEILQDAWIYTPTPSN